MGRKMTRWEFLKWCGEHPLQTFLALFFGIESKMDNPSIGK